MALKLRAQRPRAQGVGAADKKASRRGNTIPPYLRAPVSFKRLLDGAPRPCPACARAFWQPSPHNRGQRRCGGFVLVVLDSNVATARVFGGTDPTTTLWAPPPRPAPRI